MHTYFIHLLTLSENILPDPPTGTPAELAEDCITFFSTWIARMGGMIAFIGAIKLALSIKSEDAKEQLQAVLVMVSGFMIVSAVRNIEIFKMPDTYSVASANAEYKAILNFIGRWTRRVGAFALLIGSTMFGLSIKDNNANTKVSALKTISAGGLTIAVSALLWTFAYI